MFAWLLKVMLFDQDSDVVGLFVLAGWLVMAIFAAYALLLVNLFFKRRRGVQVELLFSGLLLVPWIMLWRLLY